MMIVSCSSKSALLLLFIWLPFAMEGPTPVSALIHAATLVTLGVLLFIRMSSIHSSLLIVVLCLFISVGVALLGIGVCLDIKKSIAYSTITQMMFSLLLATSYHHSLCYLYLCVHAIYKSTGFLCFGVYQHIVYRQDLRSGVYRSLSGVFQTLSLCTFFVMSACLLSTGTYKELIIDLLLSDSFGFLINTFLVCVMLAAFAVLCASLL